MPLSEHEQRMLDQIESALYAEDPKFASNVRGSRLGGAVGKRRVFAAIGFAAGLLLLIAGMLLPKVEYTVIVGIAGFLLMFGSVVYLFWAGSGSKSSSGPRGTVESDGTVRPAAPRSGNQAKAKSGGSRKIGGGQSGQSFAARMEDRFRRRFP